MCSVFSVIVDLIDWLQVTTWSSPFHFTASGYSSKKPHVKVLEMQRPKIPMQMCCSVL